MEEYESFAVIEAVGFKHLNKNMVGKEVGWFKLKTSFFDNPSIAYLLPMAKLILIRCWTLQAQNNGEPFTVDLRSFYASFTPVRRTLIARCTDDLVENQLLKVEMRLKEREKERKIDSIIKTAITQNPVQSFNARFALAPLITFIEDSLKYVFEVERLDKQTMNRLPGLAAYYKTEEDFKEALEEIISGGNGGKLYQGNDKASLKKYVMVTLLKQAGIMS